MKSRSGFTLVELSIVLVIIGLIAGGVLAGRDLIHAAEIRSVVSDIEKFNTAVYTFQNKLNCLPGDCANATDYFGQGANCGGNVGNTDGTTCNGDGNGIIDNAFNEEYLFWQHLALAGLIPGSYAGADSGSQIAGVFPTSKVPTLTYTIHGFLPHILWIDWSDATYALDGFDSSANITGLTPDDLYAIDSKMDDGKPGAGLIRIASPSSFNPATGWDNCADSSIQQTANYNIANYSGQPVCYQLLMKAPF